jgi:hypothetical protein
MDRNCKNTRDNFLVKENDLRLRETSTWINNRDMSRRIESVIPRKVK